MARINLSKIPMTSQSKEKWPTITNGISNESTVKFDKSGFSTKVHACYTLEVKDVLFFLFCFLTPKTITD